MATKYRKICPKIWNDAKFVSMSDNGKLAFFFLLTHPHMTPLGAMRATVAGLASEMGWTVKAFGDAIQEAITHGMVKTNAKASCIAIPKFLKYNQPESVNVVKAWVGCIDDIPECDLKDECFLSAKTQMESKSVAFSDAFDHAFGDSYAMTSVMPCGIQEQEQKQYQEQDQEKNKTVLVCKEPKKKSPADSNRDLVMDYLNDATCRSGAEKFSSHAGLKERLADGATVEDMKLVIDCKIDQWLDNEEMRPFIRPKTLFGPKNFPGYLSEAKAWDARGRIAAKTNGNGKSQKDRFGTEPPVSDYENVGRAA